MITFALRRFRPTAESRHPVSLLAEADRRWRRLLKAAPDDETALSQLANNRLLAGDLCGADAMLDRLRARGVPHCPSRLLELEARRAEIGSEPERAIVMWKRYGAEGGEPGISQFAIARIALAMHAPTIVREAIAALPPELRGDEQARILCARACILDSDRAGALEALGNVENYSQRRDVALNMAIRCYLADERFVELRALIERPHSPPPELLDYLLGRIEFAGDETALAAEHFARSVERVDHADSNVWLARALCALDRPDHAVAAVDRFIADHPDDHATAARCWSVVGRLHLAGQAYLKSALSGRTPEAWAALARFHYIHRDWGAAWGIVLRARRAGCSHPSIEELAADISAGAGVLGVRLPRSRMGARRFVLRSSERLVDRLVTRLQALDRGKAPAARIGRHTIALVISSLGPGGAERQVVNLANGLVARHPGDRVVLLCTHLNRTERDRFYLDQLDPRVETIEYHDSMDETSADDVEALRPYADLIDHVQPESRRRKIIALARAFARCRPDIVHGWLDETFINTVLVGHMLGVSSVVGRWGSMPPGVGRIVTERSRNNIDYLQSAYRSIARLPGLVFSSNSRLTADAYASLLGVAPRDVNVVYNGIDEIGLAAHATRRETPRLSLGIPEGVRVVGTIFRMSEEKRPLLWIDVAAALARRHPDWHFVIVGDGPMRAQVEAHAHASGLANLHLAGKQREVGAWFASFDVMLLTSRVEGVSNAVVESQMCGCPVVAPDVGGMSEAMSDGVGGRLLPEPDARDFVFAIEELLENDDRHAAMASSARKFAREKFGIDSMVANYRRAYGIRDEVVNGAQVDDLADTGLALRAA